jgi:hypothetical protein
LGEAVLLHGVTLRKTHHYGLVNLAWGRDPITRQDWDIVSNESTFLQTFPEYSERFDIEEEFLDQKSNGFQLEQSLIRSKVALSRLCLVMAVATLFLTAQAEQVVASGKRRWVDCHWERGNSYLQIGWSWVKSALYRQRQLFHTLCLSGQPDPEPVLASRKDLQRQLEREFAVKSSSYVTCDLSVNQESQVGYAKQF